MDGCPKLAPGPCAPRGLIPAQMQQRQQPSGSLVGQPLGEEASGPAGKFRARVRSGGRERGEE